MPTLFKEVQDEDGLDKAHAEDASLDHLQYPENGSRSPLQNTSSHSMHNHHAP